MRRTVLLGAAALLIGCQQPIVNIGVTPGAERIHQPGRLTSIYGLRPSATVAEAASCQRGTLRVTGVSFFDVVLLDFSNGRYEPVAALAPCQWQTGPDGDGWSLPGRPRQALIPLFHLW